MSKTTYLVLPIELQLEISSYLDPLENFNLAAICRTSWHAQETTITNHRNLFKEYDSQFNQLDWVITMKILDNPSVAATYMRTLAIVDGDHASYPLLNNEFPMALRSTQQHEMLTALTNKETECRQKCLEARDLQPLLRELGFIAHGERSARRGQILLSLPNLRKLELALDESGCYPFLQLCSRAIDLRMDFQHLQEVYLTYDGEEAAIRFEYIHLLALIPSMRSIWGQRVYADWPQDENGHRDYKDGKSNLKELELVQAGIRTDILSRCLRMYQNLERFSYYADNVDGAENFTPQILTKGLLDNCAHSMLSIHIMNTAVLIDQQVAKYISLKGFQVLQLLHIPWSDLVPPTDKEFRDDLETQLDELSSHGLNRETDNLTTLNLRALLPDSLVVLQLESCPPESRSLILSLLKSSHPSLKRIDVTIPLDAELLSTAADAGIDLFPLKRIHAPWRHQMQCNCAEMHWGYLQQLYPASSSSVQKSRCFNVWPGRVRKYGIELPPGEWVGDVGNEDGDRMDWKS